MLAIRVAISLIQNLETSNMVPFLNNVANYSNKQLIEAGLASFKADQYHVSLHQASFRINEYVVQLLLRWCLLAGFEAIHPVSAGFKTVHLVQAGFEAIHPAGYFEVGHLPFAGHESGQLVSKQAGQLQNGLGCESGQNIYTHTASAPNVC